MEPSGAPDEGDTVPARGDCPPMPMPMFIPIPKPLCAMGVGAWYVGGDWVCWG